ncbi:hypothetical protein IG631_24217 [Alternaria alternata]|nr:hypothetical protein IG631_24217 [Alternaria alternata]
MQRILQEDAEVTGAWSQLVEESKAKHGVQQGHAPLVRLASRSALECLFKVVIASERCTKPLGVQHGDRERVTLIAGINAVGWSISPSLILEAKHHDCSILSSRQRLTQWVAIACLSSMATRATSHLPSRICVRRTGLLPSMPSHSSHILQPLDVGCLALLKQAYKKELRGSADSHIDKKAFLT